MPNSSTRRARSSRLGANRKHDLPRALAELALSNGMALPISDRRCRDLAYNAVAYQPDPSSCTWIGEPGPETPARSARPGAPVVRHTAFEPMDRGGPYKASFVRPAEPEALALPLAAVGARSIDDVEG